MLRGAPPLRRDALLIRGPSVSRHMGPGSAEQRCTLHRVRDTSATAEPDSKSRKQPHAK